MVQSNSRKARSDTPEYAKVKHGMVEAATVLMAEKGLSKFRFEELAEKIGYNRATIYRYFDSKQDLVTEVMMALMHKMTNDIIEQIADIEKATEQTFTDSLYKIINNLRTDRHYAIIMDARNIETFARLTHEYFSDVTTGMLQKYMTDASTGGVLKEQIAIDDAVHWLMHQIISYGFFGLKGESEQQQKAYLKKMVVSVLV